MLTVYSVCPFCGFEVPVGMTDKQKEHLLKKIAKKKEYQPDYQI